VISLEVALEGLLRSPALRRALRAGQITEGQGRPDALDLSPEDAVALLAIDPTELESSARAFVRSVRTRSHRGCKSLERAFAATLASYRTDHPEDGSLDELFTRFVESSVFDSVPSGGESPTDEERFWRFATEASIGDDCTRNADLLAATTRALATGNADGCRLPPQLRPCPGGWFAVDETGPSPRLFAATRGRSITGAITTDVADILLGRRAPDPATRRELVSMGLF